MPIIIPDWCNSYTLDKTNFFDKNRAISQDVRPLRIAICNIMPLQKTTEKHLFGLLANNSIQINPTLFDFSKRHKPNLSYYQKFPNILSQKFDWLIITWANFDKIPFEEVTYISQIKELLDRSVDNVYRNKYICRWTMLWLHHFYNLDKQITEKKIFAVKKYPNNVDHHLLKWADDEIYIPISCWAKNTIPQTQNNLQVILWDHSNPWLVISDDNKHTFWVWHPEYDRWTLAKEYFRDLITWDTINIPLHYFPDNDKIQEFSELSQDVKIRVICWLPKKLREKIFDSSYFIKNLSLYHKINSALANANQTEQPTEESVLRERYLKPKKMRSANAQLMFNNRITRLYQDVPYDFCDK